MVTATMGTAATTTLTALKFLPGVGGNGGMAAADYAAINALILPDSANAPTLGYKKTFEWGSDGMLYLPKKRGFIMMLPGDYIAVDSTGWPIVVSAIAAASASWVHT